MSQRLLTALLFVGLALPSLAAESESASELTTPAPSLGGGILLEMVLFLALIIGLIVGLGWLVRRMGSFSVGTKGAVTVLGGVSLGPRERAVLLQVEKKRLLVGVAPGRVQTLCMLDDDEDAASFQEQLDTALEEGEQ